MEEGLLPLNAISPIIPLNLGLGGFLAILLGLGTALLLEAMDRSLKNIEEAKLLLDLPLQGTRSLQRQLLLILISTKQTHWIRTILTV